MTDGGIRYAANAILLPSLDMLSNLTLEHAPAIISHILTGRPRASGMWEHWRGRYGLTEAQQAAVWEKVKPGNVEEGKADQPGTKEITPGKKVLLRFRTYDGEVKEVDAEIGQTLLDVGKANGLPSLEGVCGGNLGPFSSLSW